MKWFKLAWSVVFFTYISLMASGAQALPLEKQKEIARANLDTISQLQADDFKGIKDLYQDIIARCADTEFAPEACWRLASLNLLDLDPPDYKSAAEALEIMVNRYPNRQIPLFMVRNRLINCYEQSQNWNQAANVLQKMINESQKMPVKDKLNYLFRYAEALNNAGEKEAARNIYQQIVSEGEPHHSAVLLAQKRLN